MIEQTKTTPLETLEFKLNKQMETFSFNPPKNLSEEGKWLKAVTSFEPSISVFNITDANNTHSITIPGHWNSKSAEKTNDERLKFLELRSQMILNYMLNKLEKMGEV